MEKLYNHLDHYDLELTVDSGIEIARPKGLFYTHPGIILGRNKYSLVEMVFHNHPNNGGPAIDSRAKYDNGSISYPTSNKSDSRYAVLIRSFEQLEAQNNYKLLDYNCQDATKYSREGKFGSQGVANTLGTIAVVGILVAMFSDGKNKS